MVILFDYEIICAEIDGRIAVVVVFQIKNVKVNNVIGSCESILSHSAEET